jgi:hypothetical protein
MNPLNLLMGMLSGIKGFFRQLLGLIIPFFRKSRDFQGISQGVRWALHILVLAGILVLLWWIDVKFELWRLLKNRIWLRIDFGDFWLPILFLLVYALGWLGWWLWKLLGPEEAGSEFPDIDAAWEEATKAMAEAGIGVAEAPLFLLLGRTEAGAAALAQAADLRLIVKPTPGTLKAPLQVFGNHEGIYVTCPDASLLGRQAAILRGEALAAPGTWEAAEPGTLGPGDDPMATMPVTAGPAAAIQEVLVKARQEGRRPDQLTAQEQDQIRILIAEDEAQRTIRPRKLPPALLKNPSEVARGTARLQHLCRLIVRDRQPWCPINGLVFLVPFSATDSDDLAHQTSEICQRDFRAARDVLKVNCPVFAMVCDMESVTGFRDFIERIVPKEDLKRRFGRSFPLVPDLEEGRALADMIEAGVDYVCTSLVPNRVYQTFSLEAPGRNDLAAATKGNVRLYQLLYQMRDRQKRFRRIVSRWTTTPQSGPYLFAGCYLAGTGENAARDQAFVAGVFDRLIREQNWISWTQEALDEEAHFQTWTTRGYFILGVIALVGVAVLVLLIKGWPW